MSRYGAPVDARERWNERYAGPGFVPFPDAPAPWLTAHEHLLGGGGRALDVACGDGRNALYLARLGYQVDAIDVSDVAIAALRKAARERGLAIAPRAVDLEREPLPPGPYDVVVTMHFLQRSLFEPLQAALAPGGVLVYETFARAHAETLGHSFNPDYLLEPGELLRAFPALEVLDHRDGVVSDGGSARGVGSLVARRPVTRDQPGRTASATRKDPIGLTVIGGFLGAGKTTLLNRILRDAGDRRLAVLVNDFGAINIDAELVESREGETISLRNGCICCSVGGDFIGELALLRDRADPPEHVVVEASGVADPGAIVVLGDMPGYRRDAAVVVADAETVRERAAAEATGHQILGQLRAADLLVLNKTDLVAGERVAELRAWLREVVGPSTAIVETSHGAVPADVVLGIDPARGRATRATRDERDERDEHHAHDGPEHDGHAHDRAGHAPHPSFESWSWSGPRPLSGTALVDELKALPDGIVRAKGLLHLREDAAHRYVLQVVGRRFSIEADRRWADGERPASQLVVIGLPGSVDAERLAATLERLSGAGA